MKYKDKIRPKINLKINLGQILGSTICIFFKDVHGFQIGFQDGEKTQITSWVSLNDYWGHSKGY